MHVLPIIFNILFRFYAKSEQYKPQSPYFAKVGTIQNHSLRDEKYKNNHSLRDFLLKTYTSSEKIRNIFSILKIFCIFAKSFKYGENPWHIVPILCKIGTIWHTLKEQKMQNSSLIEGFWQ